MAAPPYHLYDEWIAAISALRFDLEESAEEAIRTKLTSLLNSPINELVHDGILMAEYLNRIGIIAEAPTGLGVTIVGYRFVAYVDQVDPVLAAWLVEVLREFAHANDAWKEERK